MSRAITISVDGEDGSVVSRNPGIRLVGGDADLALVRVWAFLYHCSLYRLQMK